MSNANVGRGHTLFKFYNTGYHYCVRCGLVAMKNKASRKALSKPCRNRDKE